MHLGLVLAGLPAAVPRLLEPDFRMILGTLATSLMSCNLRTLRFPAVWTSFSTSSSAPSDRWRPCLGTVSSAQLGRQLFPQSAITIFRVFCVIGTCIKIGKHSLPPLGQRILHEALPLHSARFELVGTWLHSATGTSTNFSLCCTCATSTVFTTIRTYLCMVTEMSTNLSMNGRLMNLHGFLWTAWTLGTCLCNTAAWFSGTSMFISTICVTGHIDGVFNDSILVCARMACCDQLPRFPPRSEARFLPSTVSSAF